MYIVQCSCCYKVNAWRALIITFKVAI
jgi:hypothetical protein